MIEKALIFCISTILRTALRENELDTGSNLQMFSNFWSVRDNPKDELF